ncbi:MAG: propionyl-CoA synthetase [Candidatus Azotimanducaceae bacterium]|jgi:propionyl-CoA synthetase
MSYQAEFERAKRDPEVFWREQANLIEWSKAPQTILAETAQGATQWYPDGELNTAYLALDYHVKNGRGDQLALIYDSPVAEDVQKFTYRELTERVALFAGVLRELGVGKGDRVIIYLPMIPEAAIAMLACARLGAVHSVVFGGFAPKELATRIDDALPKIIVSASCGIEFSNIIPYKPLLDEAQNLASHKVSDVVLFQRKQHVEVLDRHYRDWAELLVKASPADCVPVKSNDPLYILYTSGTTGKPKGVVRDNGGHAVAMRYSMQAVYDVGPGDVFWAASDVGWVVGHSYIVYAPLITGCTTILFEGKPIRTPDSGTFWRIIQDYSVQVFFTAPTAFRAIRKEDPDSKLLEKYDISSLKSLFVAGERTDPPTYHWLQETLKVPVIDHWWQTETGWPVATDPMGLEVFETKAGSATFPVPGFQIEILSPEGEVLGKGEEGDVVIRLPLPPGCLPTVWGDHERYTAAYLSQHPGYYHTGDGGYFDDDGYLFIMGRTDDVINVAGHRLSTGEMEEVVASHPAIAECAVIGIEDVDKGQVPVGLLIVKHGANQAAESLQADLVALVRKDIGAFANFKQTVVVERLPKTRSGKILRKVMRAIADQRPFDPPATIDDPLILDEIKAALVSAGIGRVAKEKI